MRVAELVGAPSRLGESAHNPARPWLCSAVLLLGDLAAVAFGAAIQHS